MLVIRYRFLSNTRDLLTCSLGEKCRTGQTSSGGGSVNFIDQPFIEGDIDPDRATCIAQQRYGEQYSACSHRRLHVLIAQNIIDCTCRRHRSTGALQGFDVLAQGRRSICGCLCQCVACREASFHIRKPDSESAIGVLLDDRYILGHHTHVFLCRSEVLPGLLRQELLWPPSRQLVDTTHEADRQILTRVRDRNEWLPIRVLERVVIPTYAIKYPAILLQHPDQLAAVAFHVTTSSRAAGSPCRNGFARSWRWPQLAGGACILDRVYKYTHFLFVGKP